MELFSEIYGLYYHIVEDILNHAPLSGTQVRRMVAESGFSESILQLIPKLLTDNAWPLLEEKDGLFESRLRHQVRVPATLLELRWLKAVLCDPRARLFLSDPELVRLENLLFDIPPLFDPGNFSYFDRSRDGDPYYDYGYIRHFRRLLAALREQKPIAVTYRTGTRGSGARIRTSHYLPLKLEYSEKDDKFRAYCGLIQKGWLTRYVTINLGRILDIQASHESCPTVADLDAWRTQTRSPEPIVADVYPERNAINRFLLEFSSYEKQSERDEETGICQVKLWYPLQDETELLIRILGFGPVVRVHSPARFVSLLRERVQRQAALLREDPLV